MLYQQASQTALSRHAPREAALCLEKALALLQHLPESAERKQRELELRLALDHPLKATTGWASPALEGAYHPPPSKNSPSADKTCARCVPGPCLCR